MLNGNREADATSRGNWRARFDRILATALWLMLLVPLVLIGLQQRRWVSPFGRDFVTWLGHPAIAGIPAPSADLPLGVVAALVFVVIGWFAATLAVGSSTLANVITLRLGLALLLACGVAGLVGMLAVTVGRIDRGFIVLATSLIAVSVSVPVLLTHRLRSALLVPLVRPRPSSLAVACVILT